MDSKDEEYADWCLTNNWFDKKRINEGDYSAGYYVCGEDLYDNEWREWIESETRKRQLLAPH